MKEYLNILLNNLKIDLTLRGNFLLAKMIILYEQPKARKAGVIFLGQTNIPESGETRGRFETAEKVVFHKKTKDSRGT